MTAAALRPDLFTHLFATQRSNPDKGDFAASAISLLLHGSVVAALVWASATIERAVDPPEEITHHVVVPMPDPEPSESPGGGGRQPRSPSDRFVLAPPNLDDPLPDPRTPVLEENPWVEPGDNPGVVRRDSLPSGPPGSGGGERTERGGFEVVKVIPRMLNQSQVQQALQRNYPPMLRDAGIGGNVIVWLLIDENGRVIEAEIKESSGQPALDQAALKVGEIIRFSPGMNRDQRVKVWVALPVSFITK